MTYFIIFLLILTATSLGWNVILLRETADLKKERDHFKESYKEAYSILRDYREEERESNFGYQPR